MMRELACALFLLVLLLACQVGVAVGVALAR